MVSAPRLTVVLAGPTATGKTALALEFARERRDIEIINADSLLVYRALDIGTAKPSLEERRAVPHHLIDVRDPDEAFTAGDFVRAVDRALTDIESRGKRALIVGGSGFYLKALLHGLWDTPPADPAIRRELEARPPQELYDELYRVDPESALRITVHDPYRLVRAHEVLRQSGKTPTEHAATSRKAPDARFALWVIDRDADELRRRLSERTSHMLTQGLIDEAQSLMARYPGCRPLQSVGYAQVQSYLRGERPPGRVLRPGIAGLQDEIELATQQLIKRQRTWFRGQKSARWSLLERDRDTLLHELNRTYET